MFGADHFENKYEQYRYADKAPIDLNKILSALYGYRNKMFHYGFEWPESEREKFSNQKWDKTWFSTAKRNGKPWIFYMSKLFIELVLDTTENSLDMLGNHVAGLNI